jgi:hypothetical protein
MADEINDKLDKIIELLERMEKSQQREHFGPYPPMRMNKRGECSNYSGHDWVPYSRDRSPSQGGGRGKRCRHCNVTDMYQAGRTIG